MPEELDRLIHEPGRLAILTVLSSLKTADFVFLGRATGLTNGNLSSHLTKLEEAGLVRIEKRFVGKRPNTSAALTADGKRRDRGALEPARAAEDPRRRRGRRRALTLVREFAERSYPRTCQEERP